MVLAASTRYSAYNPVVDTTDFEVGFPIFNTGDLTVLVDGLDVTDFSVTATFTNGRSEDAVVVLATAANGVLVEIYGTRTPRRDQDYLGNSPDLATNLQRDADILSAVQQEVSRDQNTTFRVTGSDSISALALATSSILGTDALGNPAWYPTDTAVLDSRVRISFATRAEAEAASANTGSQQIIEVGSLLYGADESGTALTTGDGRTWSPLGAQIAIQHFAENTVPGVTDMRAAVAAAVNYAESLYSFASERHDDRIEITGLGEPIGLYDRVYVEADFITFRDVTFVANEAAAWGTPVTSTQGDQPRPMFFVASGSMGVVFESCVFLAQHEASGFVLFDNTRSRCAVRRCQGHGPQGYDEFGEKAFVQGDCYGVRSVGLGSDFTVDGCRFHQWFYNEDISNTVDQSGSHGTLTESWMWTDFADYSKRTAILIDIQTNDSRVTDSTPIYCYLPLRVTKGGTQIVGNHPFNGDCPRSGSDVRNSAIRDLCAVFQSNFSVITNNYFDDGEVHFYGDIQGGLEVSNNIWIHAGPTRLTVTSAFVLIAPDGVADVDFQGCAFIGNHFRYLDGADSTSSTDFELRVEGTGTFASAMRYDILGNTYSQTPASPNNDYANSTQAPARGINNQLQDSMIFKNGISSFGPIAFQAANGDGFTLRSANGTDHKVSLTNAGELRINDTDPLAALQSRLYAARNSSNATGLASQLADGEFGYMGLEAYEKLAAATGAGSATNDLSVDGLLPAFRVTPNHFGVNTTPGTTDTATMFTTADTFGGAIELKAEEYYIGSSISINSPVIIPHGASLSVADGVTLTLNGPLRIDTKTQVFNWTGSGAFSMPGVIALRPEWFGATNDGTGNASPAIQKALDSLTTGHVKLDRGIYDCDTAFGWAEDGKGLIGAGPEVTILRRKNVSGDLCTVAPADLTGTRLQGATIRDLSFEGANAVSFTDGFFLHLKVLEQFLIFNVKCLNGYSGIKLSSCQNGYLQTSEVKTSSSRTIGPAGVGIEIGEEITANKREGAGIYCIGVGVRNDSTNVSTSRFEKSWRITASDGIHMTNCYGGNAWVNNLEITPNAADTQVTGIRLAGGTWFDPTRNNTTTTFGEATNVHIHGDTTSAFGLITFDGVHFNGGQDSLSGLAIDPTGASTIDRVQLTGCNFHNYRERGIHVRNTGSSVGLTRSSFTGCEVRNTAISNSVPAVSLDGAHLSFVGNNVGGGGVLGSSVTTGNNSVCLYLAPDLINSTVVGNTLIGYLNRAINNNTAVDADVLVRANNDGVRRDDYVFNTRAQFVAAVANENFTAENGQVVTADGFVYEAQGNATDIPDLAGWIPAGNLIYADHFGAAGDNSTDNTTILQAAIDYAASLGTVVLNKFGTGADVLFGSGTFQISNELVIKDSGVRLVGMGVGATAIRQTDETKNGVVIRPDDPFNDDTSACPANTGLEGLMIYVDNGDQTDALAGTAVSVVRSVAQINRVFVRGFRNGFDFRGANSGSQLTNCESLGTRADGSVTVQSTTDFHLHIGAEEVVQAQSKQEAGGLYYAETSGLYVSNFETRCPNTIKVADACKVGFADGVYVTNCHFGFNRYANIRIQSDADRLTCQNLQFNNFFCDMQTDGDWGIVIDDGSGIETEANNIIFTGLRGNIGLGGFFKCSSARADNILVKGFSLNTEGSTSGRIGFDIQDGNDITISRGNISSCYGGHYVRIQTINGADRVTIEGITARDYGGNGAATSGVEIDRADDGIILENLRIYDTGGNPISVGAWAAMPTQKYIVRDVISDGSDTIASAQDIQINEWVDTFYVTGTTTIDQFNTNGAARGERHLRNITLIFEGVVTVDGSQGNNLRLSGNTYTSAAGGTLSFVQRDGTWYETARAV